MHMVYLLSSYCGNLGLGLQELIGRLKGIMPRLRWGVWVEKHFLVQHLSNSLETVFWAHEHFHGLSHGRVGQG